MRLIQSILRVVATSTLCLLACPPLQAANFYWDSNGATAGAGSTPDGTWGVDAFWNTDPAGGSGTFSTGMTQADLGVFSAGSDAVNPYTVTVSGTQDAGQLNFRDGTPTLTGGTIALGAGKTLIAESTLNGTATIASALTVNTTAATTLTLNASDGAAETDLLITGNISATTANIYQIRLAGAGNGRIDGSISGHGGSITQGTGGWTGNWTIGGNQSLGSTMLNLTGNNNKLIMGDNTSDVQTWTGTVTITTTDAVLTIRSTASSGQMNIRGGGGYVDVLGDLTATGINFGQNGISDSSKLGILKLSGGNVTVSGLASLSNIYGTGSKIVGGAATYGTLRMNQSSSFTLSSGVTIGGAGTNENNLNLVKNNTTTLTLSGANTFNGTTTISGGTLALANQNAIQNSSSRPPDLLNSKLKPSESTWALKSGRVNSARTC